MGNDSSKKKQPTSKAPSAIELKTYIMAIQAKMTLNRNKKVELIKKKRREIAGYLEENNLDIAKAKMDSLIREEDYITVFDILGPMCEILKEKVTYLILSDKCPADIKAIVDTLVYASTRLEVDELHKLRGAIEQKYGAVYVESAINNTDALANVNVVEKLKVKPAADPYIIIRLKQLCKEDNVSYEFPQEMIPMDPFNTLGGGNNFNNPYFNTGGGQNIIGNINVNPQMSVNVNPNMNPSLNPVISNQQGFAYPNYVPQQVDSQTNTGFINPNFQYKEPTFQSINTEFNMQGSKNQTQGPQLNTNTQQPSQGINLNMNQYGQPMVTQSFSSKAPSQVNSQCSQISMPQNFSNQQGSCCINPGIPSKDSVIKGNELNFDASNQNRFPSVKPKIELPLDQINESNFGSSYVGSPKSSVKEDTPPGIQNNQSMNGSNYNVLGQSQNNNQNSKQNMSQFNPYQNDFGTNSVQFNNPSVSDKTYVNRPTPTGDEPNDNMREGNVFIKRNLQSSVKTESVDDMTFPQISSSGINKGNAQCSSIDDLFPDTFPHSKKQK